MDIQYFGHAAFEFFSDNTRIWIDPFFSGNPFIGDWNEHKSPDLILATHDHGDHIGDSVDILANTSAEFLAIADICYHLTASGVNPEKILYSGNGMGIGGTIVYKDFKITMTQALHSSPHGLATGFILQDKNGFTVFHAGDTALFSDMSLLADRFSIDLALLPIGGHFTMDAQDAAKACSFLEAKAVIPMHYGTFPMLDKDTKAFEAALNIFATSTKFIDLAPTKSISF